MLIEHAAVYEVASRLEARPGSRMRSAPGPRLRWRSRVTEPLIKDYGAAWIAGMDRKGLDEMDNRILTALIDKFTRPVGASTIATAIGKIPVR